MLQSDRIQLAIPFPSAILLLLIFAAFPVLSREFIPPADVEHLNSDDLKAYRNYLNSLLSNVEKTIKKRQKRFVPVSASLPDRQSAFFLERIGALRLSQHPPRTLSEATRASNKGTEIKQNNAIRNHTVDECRQLSQSELVTKLKEKGTYNPDLMAWDLSGVIRFLDRSIIDQYEWQFKSRGSNEQSLARNVEALENILGELNLYCNVRQPTVISRLQNLTISEPRRSVQSPSIRMSEEELRVKRSALADELLHDTIKNAMPKKQKIIGDVHVVPFGCDKRGKEEDGYLRLCGACQAIRKLPDTFFPPFINEVMCDEDKACLYFYDYPHGKCKQKHMNFVVLKNIGTQKCEVWQKFNLNVRVSCECFVDEMSFFAKYV
ncbi:hypothetical protein L596_004021 [Steinernema carpocapsae]|uniref:Spaetzle domain-containing protein n=1 Tax=Steinernema carpocapsae TaxID=34508 RepID=A0A4U8UVH4_STECR|nr:hypothetical protein L596_004021 [Steinernema carpocapsae]